LSDLLSIGVFLWLRRLLSPYKAGQLLDEANPPASHLNLGVTQVKAYCREIYCVQYEFFSKHLMKGELLECLAGRYLCGGFLFHRATPSAG
jgi:hypothetical protein